jgi:hypothetical protein
MNISLFLDIKELPLILTPWPKQQFVLNLIKLKNHSMKKYILLFIASYLLFSCGQNKNDTDKINSVRKEAMEVAVKYAKDKFKESKVTVASDGTVTVSDSQISFVTSPDRLYKYIIDPSKTIIGQLDDNTSEDAIILLSFYIGQYLQTPEYLIITNDEGKLSLNRSIESDMRIISLKNKIITAEIYSHSRNSPLHNCGECKEVVKYQFRKGDLTIIK